MLPMTDKERNAWLAGEPKYVRLEFSDGNVIENDEIYEESLVIEQVLCDEDTLSFGKCSVSTFSITIVSTTVSYKGKDVTVYIYTFDEKGKKYTRNLGTYTIESDKRTSDKLYKELIGYDKMSALQNIDVKEFYDFVFQMNMNYLTVKKFRDMLFDWIGIEQVDISLPSDLFNVNLRDRKTAKSISALELIEDICEINGCFGNINLDGKFDYIWIDMSEPIEMAGDDMFPGDDFDIPDQYNIKLTKDDYFQGEMDYEDFKLTPIEQVVFKFSNCNEDYKIPDKNWTSKDHNIYTIKNNNLIYNLGNDPDMIKNYQTVFWEKTSKIQYTPTTISTPCRLDAQLGDVVLAYGTADVVRFPILKRTISGITNLVDTYEARGTEEFEDEVDSFSEEVEDVATALESVGTFLSVGTSDVEMLSSEPTILAELELEPGIWIVSFRAIFEENPNGRRKIGTTGNFTNHPNPNLIAVDAATQGVTALNATSIYQVINKPKNMILVGYQNSGKTLVVNAGESDFIKAIRIV